MRPGKVGRKVKKNRKLGRWFEVKLRMAQNATILLATALIFSVRFAPRLFVYYLTTFEFVVPRCPCLPLLFNALKNY